MSNEELLKHLKQGITKNLFLLFESSLWLLYEWIKGVKDIVVAWHGSLIAKIA